MKLFVTGISTEVGKTIASAILVEALQADYWKPIQAGDLDNSDSHKVKDLISNPKTKIYPNSYSLNTPMSPHAAAEIDGVKINLEKIKEPKTENHLVIEGAGGLLVPLNGTDTIFDLIKSEYKVVVVSRHYLGSINHSLLTINALQNKGFQPSVIFSGDAHATTESIILKKTEAVFLGRIEEEERFDKEIVKNYADQFRNSLKSL
jgi:dethiobiotin synthetase